MGILTQHVEVPAGKKDGKVPSLAPYQLNVGTFWRVTIAAWLAVAVGAILFTLVYTFVSIRQTAPSLIVGFVGALTVYLWVGRPLGRASYVNIPPEALEQVEEMGEEDEEV
jgi:VIT1/CCC1 family predicted Fe2+/Mn2+ transporter